MISENSVIAIITARGGSKGLPGKNLKELCGKPLIAWTIEKALKSKYLDKVIVSTENDEIAEISKEYGADVPFMRPEKLATDTASSIDVVVHALEYFKDEHGQLFDYVVLLEPTSPLREDNDIDDMLEKLNNKRYEFDSVISIGKVSEHPSIVKRIKENNIEPYCTELLQTSRRQDNDLAFFPYGVAYIVKTSSLYDEKTFYTKRCTYYTIKRYQNYEIDDVYDFLCVENVMKYEWRLG